MKKIMLIDCNAIGWSAFHALPKLSYDEEETAIIYGFLTTLFFQQSIQCADYIAFAWDSKKSKRRKLFPEYKEKRRKQKQEWTQEEQNANRARLAQFKLLRKEILPALGFSNVFMQSGYEGDDIIARIALDYRDNHRIRILARDNDLYQVINHNCTMYDWTKQKVLDDDYVYDNYGISATRWAEVKAIAGCPGDEVPGINGVAYGRAVAYLTGNMKSTSVFYDRIQNSPEIIKLTRKLTTLPFKGTKPFKLKPDTCTIAKLKAVAKQYGLKSFLSIGRLRDYQKDFCER